jgi:16S rRNA (guanine966-N2)-methyltransferase
MRIAGGRDKGRRIKVSRKGIRPTKALVREAIFDIIGTKIYDAEILDIFAGSGALGLEAISRGAKRCVFVEKNPKILLQNIQNFSLMNNTEVIKSDFRAGCRRVKDKQFDVIFLDPPYNKNYVQKTIKLISHYNLLKENGVIVAEHSEKEEFDVPENLLQIKKRVYGDTAVTFIGIKNSEVNI